MWRDAIFTEKLSTHNPTHSSRPLVRFSATYAAFGSPRSLVSCCKTYNRCHGRGREFESRRPRHSFQKSCTKFNETNGGAKGHVFAPFLHPFSSIRVVFTAWLSHELATFTLDPWCSPQRRTPERGLLPAQRALRAKLPACKHPTLTGRRSAATTPASL